MFCTSLRKRPEWAPIIPLLLNSTLPKLRETTLSTHDLALPLPSTHTQTSTHHRFLFLSPTSLQEANLPETVARMERLSTLTGGKDVGIIFLLSEDNRSAAPTTRNVAGTHAYMELQLLMHTSLPTTIPLLPVQTLLSLLTTLSAYHTSLSQPSPPPTPHPATFTITNLLPCTTTSYPPYPLSQHATNILTDIVPSLSALARTASRDGGETEVGGRREMLRAYLGDGVAGGVLEFWEGEWVVE